METPTSDDLEARPHVTAVVVSHDGDRWLGQVLPALAAQTFAFDRLVVADTDSRDGTRNLLHEHVPADNVVGCPRTTGFGAAVTAAVARADALAEPAGDRPGTPQEWLWLLHDDAEPAPDALEQLLAATDTDPNLGIVGPKLRGWYHRRVLLEVGVTIDGGGRRETDLERGEEDQGQHDKRSETLGVSTAGMLIRRDVWDELGGFDPYLGLMRDDVDLCWRAWLAGYRVAVVPAAVVYHAEAAAQERRAVDVGSGRIHHLDRAGALRVLLANLSTTAFALALPRLLVGSLIRALGYLVAKLPGHAADELRAVGSVLVRPRAIRRMRAARRAKHRVHAGTLRRLFPRPGHQFELAREALTDALEGSRVEREAIGRHRAAAAEGSVDAAELDRAGAGGVLLRRITGSHAALLVIGLLAVSLPAWRDLFGGGALFGGALLPPTDGASALWAEYRAGFHAQGPGSAATAAPFTALLALGAVPLFGNVGLLVTLLLLAAAPLAGLSAWLAARDLVTTPALRAWGSAAYAMAPVVTGAVAAGRLGTVVAVILLPALLRVGVRAWGSADGSLRSAWIAALLLTVVAAFVPVLWLFALVAGAAVAALTRDRARAMRIGIGLGIPFLLLLPASWFWLRHPERMLIEPGPSGPGLSDAEISPWRLLLLNPAGPGSGPAWVGLGIVVAALIGLVAARDRILPLVGWALAIAGLFVAMVTSRISVTAPAGGHPAAAWPGPALAVAAAGMLLAAVVGCAGLAERIAAREFGLLQMAAAAATALAVAAPLVTGCVWLWRGAEGPLHRASGTLVPAHVAAESGTGDRPRTLVLRASTGDSLDAVPTGKEPPAVSYALVRDAGPQLGDAELSVPRATARRLQTLAADLVSGRGDAQAERLADFAVRYVQVRAPVAAAVAAALDTVPGLERVSTSGGDRLWRVTVPTARLRVIDGDEIAALPSGPVSARAEVPAGGEDRVLVLAEPASGRWKAKLDGDSLESYVRDDWAQAWKLPAGGGELTIRHVDRVTPLWAYLQAFGLLVVIVLALPAARARTSGDSDDSQASVAVPAARRRARTETVLTGSGHNS
jgi:GT2 family glycosyltransferase